jgi:hypothetical protein
MMATIPTWSGTPERTLPQLLNRLAPIDSVKVGEKNILAHAFFAERCFPTIVGRIVAPTHIAALLPF